MEPLRGLSTVSARAGAPQPIRRRTIAALAALCVSAGAAPAASQPAEADVRPLVEALLRDGQLDIGPYLHWSGSETFAPTGSTAPGRKYSGRTPLRATGEPGVCEADQFSIAVAPDRSGAQRLWEVSAERDYVLLAIKPKGGVRTADVEACRSADSGSRPDFMTTSDDAFTVWTAGQLIAQLRDDLRRPRPRSSQTCVRDDCPDRTALKMMLWPGGLDYARLLETPECLERLWCLEANFSTSEAARPSEAGLLPEPQYWRVTARGRRGDILEPPLFETVRWRRILIINLANDVIEPDEPASP